MNQLLKLLEPCVVKGGEATHLSLPCDLGKKDDIGEESWDIWVFFLYMICVYMHGFLAFRKGGSCEMRSCVEKEQYIYLYI